MTTQGHDIDELTGIATTGHEWDGIKELNKPLPRWWVWTFYGCIVWAVGYWIVYPAFPTRTGYTKGLWGYSQRTVVTDEVSAARAAQGQFRHKLAETPLDRIKDDPELRAIPVVAVTAFAMKGDEERIRELSLIHI